MYIWSCTGVWETLIEAVHLRHGYPELLSVSSKPIDGKSGKSCGEGSGFYDSDPMDRILQQLKPGMGIAVYIAGQMDRSVSQQTNYKPVEWEGSLEEFRAATAPYEPFLPSGTDLEKIMVMYGFDNLSEAEIDGMIKHSERTGERVVVKDLRPNDRMVGAQLTYSYEGKQFEFQLLFTTKSRIHVPDIVSHRIERIAVNGHEGIYLEDEVQRQLIWVTEDAATGYPLQYEIRARQAAKEWLLSIAELCKA